MFTAPIPIRSLFISPEKTAGFQFEGILRQHSLNPQGEFEDEYRYAILRRDWLKLYDKLQIEVIV